MKKINLSESKEQQNLVSFLTIMGWKFTAIPNATFTGFSGQNKNKKEGVRSGLPDLFIIAQKTSGEKIPVFIELKKKSLKPKNGDHPLLLGGWKEGQKTKNGLKREQRDWILAIRISGIESTVCYGAEEAIRYLNNLTK